MANFAYFEVPADNLSRAKKFYTTLLGWEINPTAMPTAMPAVVEYQDVKTGEPKEGTLSMGGMYKRQKPGTPLVFYAAVEDIDKVLGKVEKLGGKIHQPKMMVPGVGPIALIQDTEGNVIGVWQPMMG
ncbi:MAG TPA: VOC family protein [Methanomicrobiales archaeon]|nr:VOC family protein [Methanomicrobiales archaeon]